MARDDATGELGVAVQSHWFSVGPLVPWAEAGVGAVATQANVDVAYGPRLLALMRTGLSAAQSLQALLIADPGAAVRQVAVVDAHGGVAAHTGAECMAYAGHVTGDGFSCQANLMAAEGVWPAMAEAFRATKGSLAARLLASLDAAEAAGGDVRGRQSAAILVVPGQGPSWSRLVDLRVDDHPEPLQELHRLAVLHEAYVLAGEGDALTGEGRLAEAAGKYIAAHRLAPASSELAFWAGVSLVAQGSEDSGLDLVRQAIATHEGWRELLVRLAPQAAPGIGRTRELLFGDPLD